MLFNINRFQTNNNELGDAKTLRLLGNLKAQLGEYAEAKGDLLVALAKYKQFQHKRGQGACHRSLGDLSFRAGEYDAAAEHLKTALTIFRQTKNRREEAHALRTVGEVQVAQGDLEAGLANLVESIPIFREINLNFRAVDTEKLIEMAEKKEEHPFPPPGSRRRKKTVSGKVQMPADPMGSLSRRSVHKRVFDQDSESEEEPADKHVLAGSPQNRVSVENVGSAPDSSPRRDDREIHRRNATPSESPVVEIPPSGCGPRCTLQ
jgi:tetratricopeptide (TPR) repeat protein